MPNLSCEFLNMAKDEIPGPPSAQLSSWSLGRPPCCARFGVVMELFYMADEAASSSVKFDLLVKLVEWVLAALLSAAIFTSWCGFCCGDARCGRCPRKPLGLSGWIAASSAGCVASRVLGVRVQPLRALWALSTLDALRKG